MADAPVISFFDQSGSGGDDLFQGGDDVFTDIAPVHPDPVTVTQPIEDSSTLDADAFFGQSDGGGVDVFATLGAAPAPSQLPIEPIPIPQEAPPPQATMLEQPIQPTVWPEQPDNSFDLGPANISDFATEVGQYNDISHIDQAVIPQQEQQNYVSMDSRPHTAPGMTQIPQDGPRDLPEEAGGFEQVSLVAGDPSRLSTPDYNASGVDIPVFSDSNRPGSAQAQNVTAAFFDTLSTQNRPSSSGGVTRLYTAHTETSNHSIGIENEQWGAPTQGPFVAHVPATSAAAVANTYVPPQNDGISVGIGVGTFNAPQTGPIVAQHEPFQEPVQAVSLQPAPAWSEEIAINQRPPVNIQGHMPHPVVSWGFGGRIIVSFPRHRRQLNVFGQQEAIFDSTLLPGHITITKLHQVAPNDPFVSSLSRFPGPLEPSKQTVATLTSFADEQASGFGSNGDECMREDVSVTETKRLIWEILKLLIHHNGDMAEESFTPKLVRLLIGDGTVWSSGNDDVVCSDSGTNEVNSELQKLMMAGRREEACELAVRNRMWAHALLIAGHLSRQAYNNVVISFARQSMPEGSPLRSIFHLFAGAKKELFQPENGTPDNPAPGLVEKWRENLAMMLSNRTSDDVTVAKHLGNILLHRHNAPAAHVCYMSVCDDIMHEPSLGVTLIGADARRYPRTFVTPAALQRTEAVEFAMRQSNSRYVSASLLPFKLAYTMYLLDCGMVDVADQYIGVIMRDFEEAKKTMSFPHLFVTLLHTTRERMTGAGVQGKPVQALGDGPGWTAGLMRATDWVASKLVGADEVDEKPVTAPVPQPQFETKGVVVSDRPPSSDSKPTPKPTPIATRKSFSEMLLNPLRSVTNLIPRSGSKEAHLGETSSYYYSSELKRWVKKGEEHLIEEEVNTLPPTDSQLRSSNTPNSDTGALMSQQRVSTAPPQQHTSMPQSLTPGRLPPRAPNQYSATRSPSQRGARSRYVDTFNPNPTQQSAPQNLAATMPVMPAHHTAQVNVFTPKPMPQSSDSYDFFSQNQSQTHGESE